MSTPARAPASKGILAGGRPASPRAASRRAGCARSVRRAYLIRTLRRTWSVAVTASAGALLLLHAVIFWKQLVSGSLADPAKGLAWVVGLAVLGLMVALRRAGVPLLWGRRALAVWVVVALVHVGALERGAAPVVTASGAVDIALTLVTLPPSVVSLALFAGALLAFWARRRRRHAPTRLSTEGVRHSHDTHPLGAAVFSPLPSRAPPAFAW